MRNGRGLCGTHGPTQILKCPGLWYCLKKNSDVASGLGGKLPWLIKMSAPVPGAKLQPACPTLAASVSK